MQPPGDDIAAIHAAVNAALLGVADIGDIHAIVNAVDAGRSHYVRGSVPHMNRLRDRKEILHLRRLRDKVPAHTQSQVDRMNASHAVRVTDVIDLSSTRKPKFRGKGTHRKWLKSAMLRCAFGIRRSISKNSSTLASSSRMCADVFRSAHSHVQQVRNAVALAIWKMQKRGVDALPHAKFASLELSFDETEVVARLGNRQGKVDLFMAHCVLRWTTYSGATSVHQLIIPPSMLINKKAETMYAAIHSHLPFRLGDLKRKCKTLFICLGSDSARSCKKLARDFQGRTQLQAGSLDGVLAVWSPCLMHRIALVMFGLLKFCSITIPLFCASVLMHQASVFTTLQRKAKAEVDKLEICFRPPPDYETKHKYLRGLFKFLDALEDRSRAETLGDAVDERSARHKRCLARARLAEDLAASDFEGNRLTKLRHYCPYGHCDSEAHARQKIWEYIEIAILHAPPPVPLCNRWTLSYPPLCWWNVIDKLGFLSDSLQEMAEPWLETCVDILDIDAFGPGDDDSYQKKKRGRFQKTKRWLEDSNTSNSLAIAVTVLTPVIRMMGSFFRAARFSDKPAYSMLPFCVAHRSPAVRCITRLFTCLMNPEDEFWDVARGLHGWGEENLTMAFTCTLLICAQIFERAVQPFMVWPGVLANIIDADVGLARRSVPTISPSHV